MKIGVYRPASLPFSVRSYIDNVSAELERFGVSLVCWEGRGLPDGADLYWDPRCSGLAPPPAGFAKAVKPLVVTIHGAAPVALPAREIYPNPARAVTGRLIARKRLWTWKKLLGRVEAVITVSKFARKEIAEKFGLGAGKIAPIYHGVDHSVFTPRDEKGGAGPYLLHVSQPQPKKNIPRIMQAYGLLPEDGRPRLVIVAPGLSSRGAGPGVEIIDTPASQGKLATMYRGAMGFIFPSLHESFGMPILEAMACGCPVVTSNGSACAEVAADAALLVDPRSARDIASAMERLITDKRLGTELREKGPKRAASFTWERCAREHLEVFGKALQG